MPKLYELTSEARSILTLFDHFEEEIPEEVIARLDAIFGDIEAKAGNVFRVMRQFEVDSVAVLAEADRLTKLGRTMKRRGEWLKEYLKECLERAGHKSLKLDIAQLSVVKNSRPSFKCAGEVPADFEKVTVELDDVKTLAAWKQGIPLPESISVSHGTHLRVR